MFKITLCLADHTDVDLAVGPMSGDTAVVPGAQTGRVVLEGQDRERESVHTVVTETEGADLGIDIHVALDLYQEKEEERNILPERDRHQEIEAVLAPNLSLKLLPAALQVSRRLAQRKQR